MSDSDSDIELVRATSGHNVAPDNRDFMIKIKPLDGGKIGLVYTLKKGQSLPYAPQLKGKGRLKKTPVFRDIVP